MTPTFDAMVFCSRISLQVISFGFKNILKTLKEFAYFLEASHLRHAPEMGIQLPKNFDLEKYKSMPKPEKIKYAKENVPRKTIISFQNACGMAMSPTFGIKTLPVRGFAGIRKENVGMVIQKFRTVRTVTLA